MNWVNPGEIRWYRQWSSPNIRPSRSTHTLTVWGKTLSLITLERNAEGNNILHTRKTNSHRRKLQGNTQGVNYRMSWGCGSRFQQWKAVHLCLKKGCDFSSSTGEWSATGEKDGDTERVQPTVNTTHRPKQRGEENERRRIHWEKQIHDINTVL